MEEFLIYTVVAGVAGIIGWHLRGIVIMYNLSQNPDKMISILEKVRDLNNANSLEEAEEIAANNESTVLVIERVGTTLYAYAKDTNQFIAQGNNLKSLLADAQKRFPTQTFIGNIAKDNPAKELV